MIIVIHLRYDAVLFRSEFACLFFLITAPTLCALVRFHMNVLVRHTRVHSDYN